MPIYRPEISGYIEVMAAPTSRPAPESLADRRARLNTIRVSKGLPPLSDAGFDAIAQSVSAMMDPDSTMNIEAQVRAQ